MIGLVAMRGIQLDKLLDSHHLRSVVEAVTFHIIQLYGFTCTAIGVVCTLYTFTYQHKAS